jgi:hypothetical protein
MRQRSSLLMFTLVLLCLSLVACGAKHYPMQITVVNRSTYPIADIRISLTSEEGWGENRLEATLKEGESAGISLGEYTEEQLSAGFHLQFYGEDGQLYSAAYGYFNPGEGMEYLWYEDGGRLTEDDEPDPSGDEVPDWNGRLNGDANSYWSWDSDLCQRNVSEFEGIWYYDGELSAESYIVIDGKGNWSLYQCAPGAESAEMDCGTFSYSTDEASTYYADSTMYDGVSYKVFELDEDVLVWDDEGSYYLME